MTIPIIILIAILLLSLGCVIAFWLALRYRQTAKETSSAETLPFRWNYIILPLVTLFLSLILTAYFYHQLPIEVAYHFNSDGSPDKWLSRDMITLALLIPQLLLTLVAGASVWGIIKLGALSQQPETALVKPGRLLSLIGNMVALPQIILCFAMIDIFSYNSYQIHTMPVWTFALIIAVSGGIILGIFFIRAIQRSRGLADRTSGKRS